MKYLWCPIKCCLLYIRGCVRFLNLQGDYLQLPPLKLEQIFTLLDSLFGTMCSLWLNFSIQCVLAIYQMQMSSCFNPVKFLLKT